MNTVAFSAGLPLRRLGISHSSTSTVGRRGLCRLNMARKGSKPKFNKSQSPKSAPTPLPRQPPPSPASAEDMLLQDLKVFKDKRKDGVKVVQESKLLATAKSIIDTLLLWDFFLVVGLLGWLAIALVPHFATKNDVLLDPWLGLWQPFTQPVLGVLMLGTIVQGTFSFIKKDF